MIRCKVGILMLALSSWLTLVMAVEPSPNGERKPGLVGVRFHEADFRRPDQLMQLPQVSYHTGSEHTSYSTVLLGLIQFPASQPVILSADADDGVDVSIDGQQVMSGWHGPIRTGRVAASSNAVRTIEVRHYQNGGQGYLKLYWSWDGQPRELIPASAFVHRSADQTRAEAILSQREWLHVPPKPPGLLVASGPGLSPTSWSEGPWLMLDKRNILSVDHLQRVIGKPSRHGEPIVDGVTDGNFQPYISVVRDPQLNRWRMWYNTPRTPGNTGESSLALIESLDGIHWLRPHRVLDTPPIQFGASVIDEGPGLADPLQRYKAGWHKDNGLQIAVSPDGVAWQSLVQGPVLPHSHDIDAIDWDPIRRRYMAFVSSAERLDPAWSEPRRIPCMSVSEDLIHWQKSWPIIAPDPQSPREQGETQFYCMAGVIARGDLLIGLVKVLRDDLNAEPGLTASDLGDPRSHAGIGYTVITWSTDGVTWQRDTEPFIDRNPQPGSWDRAHAWADEQVVHGDELYLYYAGYRLGHKSDRLATRQIGLARMKIDRYAGFATSDEHGGTLTTPDRKWLGFGLTVNADVRGELRVALCEPSGKFLPGYSFDDCEPMTGDQTAHAIRWRGKTGEELKDRTVRIVFRLKQATLYAFAFQR